MRVNSFHTIKFQRIYGISNLSSTGSNDQNFAKGTMDPKVEYFCFAKSNSFWENLFLARDLEVLKLIYVFI